MTFSRVTPLAHGQNLQNYIFGFVNYDDVQGPLGCQICIILFDFIGTVGDMLVGLKSNRTTYKVSTSHSRYNVE